MLYRLKEYEQLVISASEEQVELGLECIFGISHKDTLVMNPYLDETGRFEVVPGEYYGESYTDFRDGIEDLMKFCYIEKLNGDEHLIIFNYGKDDYNLASGITSVRGTALEIIRNLESWNLKEDKAIEFIRNREKEL